MSGPIVPPLEVTEVDGSPDGRPITKIIVSNGDLTISGRTATIDTSGTATSPGGAVDDIQLNDGAGGFAGGSDFNWSPVVGALTLGRTGAGATSDIYGGVGASGGLALQIHGQDDDGSRRNIFVVGGEQGVVNGFSFVIKTDEAITLNGDNQNVIRTGGSADIELTPGGQLIVGRDASGDDAELKMEGNAKAIELHCDENKKLKIYGGVGQTWIFDASSASGGVTFPDGSEQTTAASGGGNAFNVELTPYGAYDGTTTYNVLDTPPYGNASYSAEGYGDTDVKFHPFIAGYSGDVATAIIYCNGTGDDVELAVYADDGNGFPSTLLGTFDFDASSTGTSSTAVFSSTITTVRGTQYWLGHTGATAVSLRTSSATYAPGLGPVVAIDNTQMNAWLWDGQTSHQTVVGGDKTDFVPKKIERIKLGFTWS